MNLFDENPKRMCCCTEAIKKGIYTKTITNDSFCIYGNLMHGRSILLNYHGKLTKNNDITNDTKSNAPNIYLYYCFDNNWNEKKIVNMNVCNTNNKLSYCSIIDIPEKENINLAFTSDDEEWDLAEKGTYYLKIYPDIEKAILRRYNLDSTPPTIVSENLPAEPLNFLKKLKEKTYTFFSSLKTLIALKHQ